MKLVSELLTGEKYNTQIHSGSYRCTDKLFQPVITLRHPGPPSDINSSVIKPKETPAFLRADSEQKGTKLCSRLSSFGQTEFRRSEDCIV